MAVAETKPRHVQATARTEPQRATYFLGVTLQNVRCFGQESQVLDLSDDAGRPARWTIILGENGTGKTTLLQILAGFQSVPYHPPSFPDETYEVPRIVVYFQTDDELEILRGPRSEALVEAMVTQLPTLESQPEDDQTGKFKFVLRQKAVQTFKAPFQPPVCYGYGAGRRPSGSSLADKISTDGAATLFADDAKLRSAEEWLLRADYSASKPSEIQESLQIQLDQVKQLLEDILPDVSGVRFTRPTRANPTPSVQFQTPYGWVPFKSLGLGYRSMVAWMVDLASRLVERYPDSSDPLSEPAVVLLDEIDLHLHPAWQRKLVSALTRVFRNAQFIVTAHSPLIVQGAGDANVVVLKREGDHVVIDNDVKTVRGWRIDQILTSDLFGLPTARPPELDKKLARRKELLSKPKLSKAETREIASLEEQIGTLPTGETDEDARKMLRLAEESSRLLKKYEGMST